MLYSLLFALLRLISYLPLRALYVLSDCFYPIIHYVARYRLGIVRKNLRLAFPEKSDAERRDIERRFYHYFCDLAVEIVKGVTMSADEFRRRVVMTGLDDVADSLAGRDFCFLFLGHFGNWEWLTTIPLHTDRFGMTQIYHPMRNKAFDRWFLDNRARFGAISFPMKHLLRCLLTLRGVMQKPGHPFSGYVLGCIADQLPKKENIHHRVTFLGQSTAVFTGSERLGIKLNASFVYIRVSRPRRGYYHADFEVMATDTTGLPEFALTDDYMRRFEADVRRQPELWLWTHDRWRR